MKRMITLVAAAAVALTSITATPAAALGKNEREVLGILLGLAVLGAIVNESQSNNRARSQPQTYYPQPKPHRHDPPPRRDRWEDRITWLPASCERTVRINRENREVVSAQCLREYGFTARLPNGCAFDIRTDWGTQRVYGKQCLADNGYRVARR
jgi:hypothetical protein